MKIDKVVETPQGTVLFQGELSEQETGLVVEAGLCFLMMQGALPMIMSKAAKDAAEEVSKEGMTIQ